MGITDNKTSQTRKNHVGTALVVYTEEGHVTQSGPVFAFSTASLCVYASVCVCVCVCVRARARAEAGAGGETHSSSIAHSVVHCHTPHAQQPPCCLQQRARTTTAPSMLYVITLEHVSPAYVTSSYVICHIILCHMLYFYYTRTRKSCICHIIVSPVLAGTRKCCTYCNVRAIHTYILQCTCHTHTHTGC